VLLGGGFIHRLERLNVAERLVAAHFSPKISSRLRIDIACAGKPS
jgi:hypothetical protein